MAKILFFIIKLLNINGEKWYNENIKIKVFHSLINEKIKIKRGVLC